MTRDTRAWGPFISPNYQRLQITRLDIIFTSVIFGLSIVFALSATYIGARQTRACRRPLKSPYVWMIWLEIFASLAIAFLCLFFLLKMIPPSFYLYFFILVLWSIQVQVILQIIINRIRVILPNRRKGRKMLIGVAVLVTMINISVFCIWLPARLQISERYIHINDIWDRTEKGIFFLVDAILNWYFIRVVKANLVRNGLQKYNRLVRFNQRMILISLLMDVLIIAAMSIPNGFVYAICHPLAYLVKLNIELIMANLIKKVAVADSQRADISVLYDFATSSLFDGSESGSLPKRRNSQRLSMFWPIGNAIRKTEEYSVHSTARHDLNLGTTTKIAGSGLPETHRRDSQLEDLALSDIIGDNSKSSTELPRAPEDDEEAIIAKPEPVKQLGYD